MSTKFSNWLRKKDKTSMKPAGCLDGIFQLFDRQHLLSRRQLDGPEKEKNPSGQALLSLTKQEADHRDLGYLEKNLCRSYQENSISSMESSSATSFTSSSKSFSSLEQRSPRIKLRCSEQSSLPGSPPTNTSRTSSPHVKNNNLLKPIDSPRPIFDLSKLKDLEESLRILAKLKELPKDFHEVSSSPQFSCEILGELKGIKHADKQREHRRLSLDSMEDSKRRDFNSKFNSLVEELKRNSSHRVSESSTLLQDLERNEIYPNIVAKLMGLEPISPAKKSTIKASDHKCKQGKSSQSPLTSPKSQSINHNTKFNSSTRLVVEEGSMKQKTGSVHCVKEKMLQKLQFQHNSKEISRKSSGDWNYRHPKSKSETTSISERDLLSPIMATKPASKSAHTSSSKFAKPEGLSGLRKIRTSDSSNRRKETFIVDGEQTPTGNTANSFSKSSCKETSRRAGNSSVISPRFQNRKPDHEKKPNPVIPSCDLRNTQRQSRNRQQSESVSPIGRIKQKQMRDNEVSSHLFQQTKGNTVTSTVSSAKQKQHQMIPRGVHIKELEKVAPPLPSPNSVLDASLYSDDSSLSPLSVSSISNDHNLKFAELPFTRHSNLCFGADSQKSETMGTIVDQFIVLGSTTDEPTLTNDDPDNKYVAALLMEHTPSVLEKINTVQPSEAGEKNNTHRLHRQLVYDVVNEILARKKEAFSSGLIKHHKFRSPQLLKELRSEIKCLQSSRDGTSQDKDPIFTADLIRRSKAWDRFESEVPVIVLEAERLIFADLIDEIVSSLSPVVLERKEGRKRQLFV